MARTAHHFFCDLAEAARRLRSGEPVAIPTETVYGLAAPIDSPSAVETVFRLKERPFFDPLIVHVSRADELDVFCAGEVPSSVKILAARFWPGPLTLVVPRRADLNPMICAGLPTVGVRCPAHPFARRLIRSVGVPLAAPSANKFTRTSPTSAEHVRAAWPESELFVLDGGRSSVGIESTVLRATDDGLTAYIEILRPGIIGEREIVAALSACFKSVSITAVDNNLAPGQTPEHYRPGVPLVIAASRTPLAPGALSEIAVRLGIPTGVPEELVLNSEAVLAARELYAGMHRLSALRPSFILVRKTPEQSGGAWEAIWDRLDRAASLTL